MATSTLKRLPPGKRPRKAKANTRGLAAAARALSARAGECLAARQAVERCGGLVTGQ